jgi:murein DD-endopeptidase MepM/ murein hydrolase activator NlpD
MFGWLVAICAVCTAEPSRGGPLLRAVDLNVGESAVVELCDGTRTNVKLLDLDEWRDELRSAVREARVKVQVNGAAVTLVSGPYRLPVTVAGVQIDCPITHGYVPDSKIDPWGLLKDARLRLWPAGSPWTAPGMFLYPARQRWFASDTQMSNEPAFVDGAEFLGVFKKEKIYYHYGLDIGGAEELIDVLAAADGLVVSVGPAVLPGFTDLPVRPEWYSLVFKDANDWYYGYAHLKQIDPTIRPGRQVKMGEKLAVLSKEGMSGGWSHLHFDIHCRQPSGAWGVQDGYAFLWEAYRRQDNPALIAVARPHQLARVGQKVTLDGSRSHGPIARYDWTLTDGRTASGARIQRTYDQPGTYSEVLKITGTAGHVEYDFAVVQVAGASGRRPPAIHAAYAPTFGIKPGDPVAFHVRTFGTSDPVETWTFGDGSPPVPVKSDGNARPLAEDGYAKTVHRFDKPGQYLVRVEHTSLDGMKAIAHLHVRVEDAAGK